MTEEEKREQLRQLAGKVSACHLCKTIYSSPGYRKGDQKGDHLCHAPSADPSVINHWNTWVRNYNPDILIVGQDFGRLDSPITDFDSPTDRRIKKFLGPYLNRCFFTNAACCYRQRNNSGPVNESWLTLCVSQFFRDELEILDPKIIIVLGEATFRSLACCRNSLLALPQDPMPDTSFRSLVDNTALVELRLLDRSEQVEKTYPVYPVYHPSTTRNRDDDLQNHDWQRILSRLNKPT